MGRPTQATIRIVMDSNDDAGEIARLTVRLRAALRDLDVLEVELLADEAPTRAKGGVGAVLGWLSVTLGGELLKTLADRVADWATGIGRTVEISVDGDTLKLGRVTREEQRELTRAWLARHPVEPATGHDQQPSLERGYL
jgi:hypothetical protein